MKAKASASFLKKEAKNFFSDAFETNRSRCGTALLRPEEKHLFVIEDEMHAEAQGKYRLEQAAKCCAMHKLGKLLPRV